MKQLQLIELANEVSDIVNKTVGDFIVKNKMVIKNDEAINLWANITADIMDCTLEDEECGIMWTKFPEMVRNIAMVNRMVGQSGDGEIDDEKILKTLLKTSPDAKINIVRIDKER